MQISTRQEQQFLFLVCSMAVSEIPQLSSQRISFDFPQRTPFHFAIPPTARHRAYARTHCVSRAPVVERYTFSFRFEATTTHAWAANGQLC